MKMKSTLILIFLIAFISQTHSQSDLKVFPKGTSPQEIGLRVATHFAESPHPRKNRIIYPEVCAWYGALTFADLTKNKMLSNQLEQRLAKLVSEEKALIPPANHVDFNVFGTIPLEQYLQTKNPEYLKLGIAIADSQWLAPTGKLATPEAINYHERGYTYQTRLWIDDMFMITEVQSQAYRATGDVKYINRAAREMVLYLDSLQKPNGLFYHAPDVPYFWSRGDGWMAAGMSELLRALPKNNPDRPRIMRGYKLMMESLLKYQTKEGMWNQLIDDPNSWAETSGTGMFTFAMITGVKNGWLDKKTYGKPARKGWLALITYINENNDVREVCEGTNKKNDHQYYLDRKRIVGDMHGQAPVLWCASALLR
jgi:unsaturated rhamnogalacturonyl hydrolase